MVEPIEDIVSNTTYGLTTVKLNPSIKVCRRRKMWIEYYVNPLAIILVLPKSCGTCRKIDECNDDFLFQIIEKSKAAL